MDSLLTQGDLEEAPPVVRAAYPGVCDGCGAPFEEGDRIQSDNQGCWLAECCLVEKW